MKSALKVLGIKSTAKEGAVGLEVFLQTLPELMGYDFSFRREDKDDQLHYELEGPEVDSLMAENPNMLESLSHISMRILRKTEGLANEAVEGEVATNFYVSFDANGFKEKKIQDLKDLAAKQRQKVLDNDGKPAYLPALSPAERKVIHTTLLELGDVMSESIGKGNFKRIRVRMKDDKGNHRSNGNNGGRGRNAPRTGGRGGKKNFSKNGGGQNRKPRNDGPDPDGNRVVPDEEYPKVDDNIGNRLAPGEDSPYYPSSDS